MGLIAEPYRFLEELSPVAGPVDPTKPARVVVSGRDVVLRPVGTSVRPRRPIEILALVPRPGEGLQRSTAGIAMLALAAIATAAFVALRRGRVRRVVPSAPNRA